MAKRLMDVVLQGWREGVTTDEIKGVLGKLRDGEGGGTAVWEELKPFQVVLLHWGVLPSLWAHGVAPLEFMDAADMQRITAYLAVDSDALLRDNSSMADDSLAERSGVLFELAPSPYVQLQITLVRLISSISNTNAASQSNESRFFVGASVLVAHPFFCSKKKGAIRSSSEQAFQLLLNPYYHYDLSLALCCLLRCIPEQSLPLTSVLKILVRQRGCVEIIIAVTRNCPERFDLVVSHLVVAAVKYPDAAQALHRLAEHSLWCAVRIRDALYDAKVSAELVLHLTLHSVKDVIDFCTASLRHECSWLRSQFQANQEKDKTPAANMRGFLLHAMDDYQAQSPRRLAQLLHLCSGVCGMWGLRLSQGSSERILAAITAQCGAAPSVALYGLCFLLVCEGLCKLASSKSVNDCILALLQSPIQPLVLLCAVRFHAKQYALNAQWAKAAVGVPVSIHAESLQQMGQVWRDCIPEASLVSQALASTPVLGLRADMEPGRDASALTMKELLRARLFCQHRSAPGPTPWLCSQLEELEAPLHEAIPELVDDFTECCVNISSGIPLTPLSSDIVRRLQASPRLVVRLVTAYLVLQHNSLCATKNRTASQPYSRTLVEGFALRRLLAQVEGDPLLMKGHGAALVSRLTELCISEHPEVMVEELSLSSMEEPVVASWLLHAGPDAWPVSELRLRLEQIARMTDDSILQSTEVMAELFEKILPQLLREPLETSDSQVIFASIWRRLYRLHPVQVSLAFLWCVRAPHHSEPPATSEALIRDPLLVMRIDTVVFGCAPLYGAVLEMLNGFASASRKRLEVKLLAALQNMAEKERVSRLYQAQDCAICQLVIEVCARGSLRIQELSCGFLHQVWIQNPDVLHLLHHQGYSMEAVPILVELVPSMHVCIDFLPTLLSSQAPARKVWAIYVASYILCKHPTPRSLEVATLLMQNLLDAARATPIQSKSFLQVSTPSIRRILQGFPVLLDQFVEICGAVATVGGDRLFFHAADVFDLPK